MLPGSGHVLHAGRSVGDAHHLRREPGCLRPIPSSNPAFRACISLCGLRKIPALANRQQFDVVQAMSGAPRYRSPTLSSGRVARVFAWSLDSRATSSRSSCRQSDRLLAMACPCEAFFEYLSRDHFSCRPPNTVTGGRHSPRVV